SRLVPHAHHGLDVHPGVYRATARGERARRRAELPRAAAGRVEPDDVLGPGRRRMTEVVMQAEDVHKRFGRLEVLKGVSLKISKGETGCILGPSGHCKP